MSEEEHELLSLDRPSGMTVNDDWQVEGPMPRRCVDCGDEFTPQREKQIRCTYCAAVNA